MRQIYELVTQVMYTDGKIGQRIKVQLWYFVCFRSGVEKARVRYKMEEKSRLLKRPVKLR